MKRLFIYITLLLTIASCSDSGNAIKGPAIYEGPIQQASDMVLYHSEAGQVKTKLITPLLLEYQSGDREFPEGIYIEFFDETGKMTSTLKANEAHYFKDKDHWRGRGDVVVESLEENRTLETEELFWEPGNESIRSEKFVSITGPDLATRGWGLEAKQDFSEYHIKKPHKGKLMIDDE